MSTDEAQPAAPVGDTPGESYWDPRCPAGRHDDEGYRREHFDPYSMDLTRGRYIRIASELGLNDGSAVHSDAYESGFWSIGRYADVIRLHAEPETFSSFPVTIPPFGNERPMIPLEMDPPVHRYYRRIIAAQLAKSKQQAREGTFRRLATECIDSFIDDGRCDIAKQLCGPVAVRALFDLIGVPDEDTKLVENAANALVRKTSDPVEAAGVLMGYFQQLLEVRREDPRDDIVTELINARIDDKPLSDEEILDYCLILVPAGFETTSSTMGYAFLMLAERPELQAELRANPQLIPQALDEVLRYATPPRSLSRTVASAVDIAGRTFEPGDRVHINWAAANHDPEMFSCPADLDIHRRPNPHLSYGYGAHLCIGMHMAREEMRVTVEEALRRLDNIRLEDASQVVEEPGTTWGITGLPVTFTKSDR